MDQLGNLPYLQGDYQEARWQYLRALEIEEQLGNQAGMASSYHQLGNLAQPVPLDTLFDTSFYDALPR